jgi:hypothetical protein
MVRVGVGGPSAVMILKILLGFPARAPLTSGEIRGNEAEGGVLALISAPTPRRDPNLRTLVLSEGVGISREKNGEPPLQMGVGSYYLKVESTPILGSNRPGRGHHAGAGCCLLPVTRVSNASKIQLLARLGPL